jgi:uncharacterized protein YjbI with pentapeptide repeats
MLRSLIFVAAAMLMPMGALAQQGQPAPPANPGPPPPAVTELDKARADAASVRICDKITDTAQLQITAANVQAVRDCQDALRLQQERERIAAETERLAAETASIKLSNSNTLWMMLAPLAPVLVAFLAIVPATMAYSSKSRSDVERSKFDKSVIDLQHAHDRVVRQDEKISRLLDDLSAPSPSRQVFAASRLLSLIQEGIDQARHEARPPHGPRMLVSAMFARLRGQDLLPAEAKYIADGLSKFFPKDPAKASGLNLREFDLQTVKAPNAYLADIDASGADFFEADLTKVSFRRANLAKAIFKFAKLHKVVFADADLQGADLRGAKLQGALLEKATGLSSAVLDGETTYDAETKWPPGFDPRAAGLKEVAVVKEAPSEQSA